jgi:hypothetical protein
MIGKVQSHKDFHTLSAHVFIFVVTCFYVGNKFEKIDAEEENLHFRGI